MFQNLLFDNWIYDQIERLHDTSYYRDQTLIDPQSEQEAFQLIEFLKNNQQHPVFERGTYSLTELNQTISALIL